MNEIPKRVLTVLQKAVDSEFWGDIELKFQLGRVVLIRKTEIEKVQPYIIREKQNVNQHLASCS
jgi:hypothetical protein